MLTVFSFVVRRAAQRAGSVLLSFSEKWKPKDEKWKPNKGEASGRKSNLALGLGLLHSPAFRKLCLPPEGFHPAQDFPTAFWMFS